jgi:hypothetical protein
VFASYGFKAGKFTGTIAANGQESGLIGVVSAQGFEPWTP